MARANAQYQSDLAAGNVGALQRFNQWLGQFLPTPGEVRGSQAAQTPFTPAPQGTYRSRPSGVPPGSQYSPSRRQWRDSRGNLYGEDGKPVQ
jgi:hypothetical protein